MKILDKDKMGILYFDFSKRDNYQNTFGMHCHNAYELIYFVSGNAIFNIEGNKHILTPNDLLITKPKQYHSIDIFSDFPYIRFDILIDESSLFGKFLDELNIKDNVINCANSKIIQQNFNNIANYIQQGNHSEDFYDLFISNLIEILINLKYINKKQKSNLNQNVSSLTKAAIDYINNNLYKIKNVDEIANELHISRNYLFRLFSSDLNLSPQKYIRTKRLLCAQSLIKSGKNPSEIYEAVGFNNYVSFYKMYVSFFGYSPKEEKANRNK